MKRPAEGGSREGNKEKSLGEELGEREERDEGDTGPASDTCHVLKISHYTCVSLIVKFLIADNTQEARE